MGEKEAFEKAYGTDRPLGVFIRAIVGLDRNAAKEAFSGLLAKSPLSANQIRFIDLIIDHLVLNGVMNLDALFEPPFTHIHDQGVSGLFAEDAEKVVSIIRQVNENAVVAT